MLDKAFKLWCLQQCGQLLLFVPVSIILVYDTCSWSSLPQPPRDESHCWCRERRIYSVLSRIAIVQPWQKDAAGSFRIPRAVALTIHLAQFSNYYTVSDEGKVGQSDAR